jgi:hypothetical protein
VREAFIVDEAAQMTHENAVCMFRSIGFVAADQGDAMIGAKPGIEVFYNCSEESTAGIRVDGIVRAERTIVPEVHCGNGEGSIVLDWIGLRKFGIVLNDK